VRRGVWQPPAPLEPPAEPRQVPTFHEFASEWFEAQKLEGGRTGEGLTSAGAADLEWRLCSHLLPAFASKRLDQITVEDVDRYRRAKVQEAERRRVAAAKGKPLRDRGGRVLRPLSVTSINKTLVTLGAILDAALDYELVTRNVAKGRRRRLPGTTPRRTWIDRADHIVALLDAAGELDAKANRHRGQRRALLATLIFGGPRVSEALSLSWRDVDLARGVLTIRGTKTEAADRKVTIEPVLRDELAGWRARVRDAGQDTLVFCTSAGKRLSISNVRSRILIPAVELANKQLVAAGQEPLQVGLTPYSLRRTFASLLYAIGEAPPYVMQQMGHTSPNLALAIYAKCMDRRDGEPERLKALVKGIDWAPWAPAPLPECPRRRSASLPDPRLSLCAADLA
jgi:integrase